MVKAISLVRRRPDLDRAEFAARWRDDYAPVARRLPGLRRYTVNVVTDASDHQDWDGFAEIWFDSMEVFEQAFANEALAAELDRGREAFIDDHHVYLVDETEVMGGDPVA